MTRMLITLLAAIAVLSSADSPIAVAASPLTEGYSIEAATSKQNTKWLRQPQEQAATPDKDGKYRYIVQFEDQAVPLYRGGIQGLAATNVGGGRMNMKSAAAVAYVSYLRQSQSNMLASMSAEVGAIDLERTYQHALNGATVRMTEAAANKIRRLPGVRLVERDRAVRPATATSTSFIGADQVWNGSATGVPFLGEGIVVGVIDTGINHDHPSFAAVGGDGFTHTNPISDGSYLGECITFPGLCNDKLIGAYTFLDAQTSPSPDEILLPGDPPSTDTDGHGSHTASTAAGNFVFNVGLPDADGNPSGVSFSQISGVAPHANVVAFNVCAPGCFFSDIVAAVDQAIVDGVVDVLNHSIGSAPGNPWQSAQAQAFLNARAAGIFVANSAGNDGPDAGTAEAAGNAPWVAGVAATTHDRTYAPKLLQNMSGGATAAPADTVGRSVSGGITGNIVYAGDFPTNNGTANDTEPEQCLEPFPAGTFAAGQIVLCDRGAIARVAKGQHVRDGGASGFILGNLDGAATSVNNDPHVVPAIHVNAADANVLRAWLAGGTGHTGTITAVEDFIFDAASGDNVADFSSRGPYTGFDILAPNTAAPGVDIIAGGADLTPAQIDLIHALYNPNNWESVPGTFGQIGGTSMASPHIAGTAALLKQAHPDWTDAEVLSAIMTTGTYDLVKEDGVTPADSHDIGGGRVQVAAAINAGLLLDESASIFQAADPDTGGDPSSLNVAGLVKGQCVEACSWTRTVTATVDGTWTAAGFDPWVSVTPASFNLAAGESQVIEVTADVSGQPGNAWSFNRAVLTPSNTSVPTTQLPIAVVSTSGDLPASIDLDASRDAGSQLYTDVTAKALSGFNVKIYEPTKVEGMDFALPGDSDNGSAFDDLTDGVTVVLHDVPAGTQRSLFEVLTSESPDLDLFVGLVLDPANPVDASLLVCVSATGTAFESCDLDAAFLDQLRDFVGSDDLTFYAVIQNWGPSSPTAVDAFTFAATNVGGTEATSMSAVGPFGSLPALTPFDVRFFWDLPSTVGDRYISTTEWYGDAARAQLLGLVPLQFNRGVDDVAFASDAAGPLEIGDVVTFTTSIQPNFTTEDRTYTVSVPIPNGLQVDPASINEGGVVNGNTVEWTVTRESLLGQEGAYTISTNANNMACDTSFGGYVDLAAFGILPDATFTGDTIAGTFFSGQNPIEFFGRARDTGFTVTDDGFGFFESTPGPEPWINQLIPDPTEPNDLLAPLWSDWFVNFDNGSGGRVRGVTAATAGPDVSIVEWDGMEFFPGDGTFPIAADFQVVMFSTPDPVFPEFVFAYDNLDPDFIDLLLSSGFITTGVENGTGTTGSSYPGPYTDGLMVCLDYQGTNSAPSELSFSATIMTSLSGKTVSVTETNVVDNPGSEPVSSSVEIEVESLPYIFSGFLHLPDGKMINLDRIRWLPVVFRLFDPVTGHIVRNAKATYDVIAADGTVVVAGKVRYSRFLRLYSFWWRLRGLEPGDYTITAHLDDGTSHSVSVTLFHGGGHHHKRSR